MGYNVAIMLPGVPANDAVAWDALDAVIDAEGPVPPIFDEFLLRLTATYPCICDLPNNRVDDGVWSDGPLRDNLGHQVSVLGMVSSRVDEVLPFLIREANALGLVVFDWGAHAIHRPKELTR